MKKEIEKYRPFGDIFDLRKELDSFFSRFPRSFFDNYTQDESWMPLVDIEETKSDFIIKAELPGLKKDDIKINLDDNVLTIEGERKSEKEDKEKTYHRIERFYGKFYRAISLPKGIDENNIKAKFENGLLEITLPKSEKIKSKNIEIK